MENDTKKEVRDLIKNASSAETGKSYKIITDKEGHDCFYMMVENRRIRVQEFETCAVVSVKIGDNDFKEIIKAWKLESERIYFSAGIIDDEHNSYVEFDEFKFIYTALASIYQKIYADAASISTPLYFGSLDMVLPKEFTVDDFDQKFLNKVAERLQAIDIGAAMGYLIQSALKLYEETGEKELLIDIAAAAAKGYIHNRKYESISWSKMTEFSEYPLRQRVNLYVESWNNTGNSLFLLELISLMYKNYN